MAVTRKSRPSIGADAHRHIGPRNAMSRPPRPQRFRILNYAEESTDEDEFLEAASTSSPDSQSDTERNANASVPRRLQTRVSQRLTIKREARAFAQDPASSRSRRNRVNHRQRSKADGKARPRIGQKRSRPPQSQAGKRRKAFAQSAPDSDHMPSTNIPDWRDPRIPFECWADIFLFAAKEGSTEVLSNNWLIHAATTCKAFAESAITAVYRCPTIKTAAKARRLASLLERPPSETLYNYRVKIDALHINIQTVPQAILFQLIHPLSRLKELIIFTSLDQPPYRGLDIPIRWHYPDDVFRALEAASNESAVSGSKAFPTILKNWEWSGRFIGGFVPDFDAMTRIHQTVSFSQLTRLCLTNFQVPSLKKLRISTEEKELESYHEDGAVIESVARAISQLSELKHLVVESSTVMNDRLLPLLPKNLTHFELINCWEVKSDDLAAFLRTHGSDIRSLTLSHNQSLDLGFLTDLAENCPKLKDLDMNLSYYRHHDCINDADPMYDQALLPDQVPNWPDSLRVLNIEHIRDWSVDTAEMFLQSIINSAPRLTELRYLAIKTMLDIPWQARATMRRKWRSQMERVFLRPFVPPNRVTHLASLPDVEVPEPPAQDDTMRPSTPPSRRSGRIASLMENLPESHDSPDKTLRHSGDGKPSYKEPDTDDDEFESDVEQSADKSEAAHSHSPLASTVDDGEEHAPFIHGKCTTVNILFDNQKVRELQYSMEDFGSEESDSEEEWDGDHEEDENIFVF